MPFTMIVSFQSKPGEEQRLQDELNAMIEPSLAEPGCLAYRPLVEPFAATTLIRQRRPASRGRQRRS